MKATALSPRKASYEGLSPQDLLRAYRVMLLSRKVPGEAIFLFAPDGGVLNRIPNGKILQGAWTIKDNTVCVDWKNQPPNPCSRYDKQGDTVTVINVSTGQPRGRIVKSADGNVERLAP